MERLETIGHVRTYRSSEIKNVYFGIGLEKLDRAVFDPSKTYDPIAELGVKHVRLQSGWMRTEKTEGVYDFGWLDEVVDNLISRGLEPWLCLCYGNPLYSEDARKYYGAVGCPPIYSEREKTAWANYCRATAEHYLGRVKMYEIWNEPMGKWCWKRGPSATEYGQFAADTARTLKSVSPDIKVLGGSFHHFRADWIETALSTDDMYKYIDAVTYHGYSAFPERVLDEVAEYRKLLAKFGDIPLIQGESGCPSSHRGHGAINDAAWTEAKQAKVLLRRQIIDLATGVELSTHFTTVDMIEALNGIEGDTASYLDYGYFGVLAAQFDDRGFSIGEYRPKMSYYALQNICGIFGEGADRADLAVTFAPERSCYIFSHNEGGPVFGLDREEAGRRFGMDESGEDLITAGFRKSNGSYAYAYYKPTNVITTSFESTVSFEIRGVSGEARIIDPMDGRVCAIPEGMISKIDGGYALHNAPLRDYPLIITFGNFCETKE